ncbi:MAG TPA: aldose 1-epimerase family protein [Candidatus Blautia excrementipullorum]|nr:aldose 1-epimerase family protein [Candidatus Blautia excrementipullorum]
MNYQNEKKYIGHKDQLMKVKRIKMQEGKASGVDMIDVQNRSGMHFDVNVSRGMDIPYLDFCGENVGFISPCGVVAPEYFDDKELGFLKSFTAGFLTTCGLKAAGAPCEYEGTAYGLHGNLSHTPAEDVSCRIVEDGEVPAAVIRGTVRDAVIFGDKMTLEREIKCFYKERKFTLHDKVTNDGYKKVRQMILYHCNIGYPILTPDSEIYIPSLEVKARNAHAQEGIDSWMKLQEADPDYEEMCYYHKLKPDENNHATAAIYNPELELGIAIEIDLSTLDHFVQWKMMGAGDYVMGLEPGNSTIDGIEDAVNNGSMKYLEPGESREYQLTFHILKGRESFEKIKKKP